MARLKRVEHEDRLALVDHLDELRSRLIVSAIVFGAVFVGCFLFDNQLLDIAGGPLDGKRLITLSPAEQFTTTLTVVAYAAIIVSMPVLLFQLYSFILPAFNPGERRVALPLLLMVPFLFIGGALFGYYVILPPALEFLLGFNAEEFQTELRAREYYSFAAMSLLATGLLFQTPVVILALTRLGVVTPKQLRKNRKYAILAIAVVAALLPSVDPVTMVLTMLPLFVLFEGSLVIASVLGGRNARGEVDDSSDEDEQDEPGDEPEPPPAPPREPVGTAEPS